MLTLARAMPDPCAPSVLHVFNLWSHEVAVVSILYLEATYVNELLTKSLDLVLITSLQKNHNLKELSIDGKPGQCHRRFILWIESLKDIHRSGSFVKMFAVCE